MKITLILSSDEEERLSMGYTDAELLMATQVAYLDFKMGDRNAIANVADLVEHILEKYGTYDTISGTYIIKEGVNSAEKAQFETAKNIMDLSKQNNVNSWRNWTILESCNDESTSGYYGSLIDAGAGRAIVCCRGSESFSFSQIMKDWVLADIGRMNNNLTKQQADATECVGYLYEKYGSRYHIYNFTGHSLGGSLATHAAITAPEEMQNRIDRVISYDGPGFSDEYLKKYEHQIKRVKAKLSHYEYSWVGSLLIQPKGIDDRVIKAHNDRQKNGFLISRLYRHHTRNIEFDGKGDVMAGKRGVLQITMGPVSRFLEKSSLLFQLEKGVYDIWQRIRK